MKIIEADEIEESSIDNEQIDKKKRFPRIRHEKRYQLKRILNYLLLLLAFFLAFFLVFFLAAFFLLLAIFSSL